MKALSPSRSVRRAWFTHARAPSGFGDVAMLATSDGRMFPAWRSHLYASLGHTNRASEFWDVYAQFNPGEVIQGEITHLDSSLAWAKDVIYHASDWVTDDIQRIAPIIDVDFKGVTGVTRWEPTLEIVDSNPARIWWRWSGRIGPLVIVMNVKTPSLSDILEWELEITHSDPTTQDLECEVDSITLSFGEAFVIDKNGRGASQPVLHNGGFKAELLPAPTVIGDGQMLHPTWGAILAVDNSIALGELITSSNPAVTARIRDLVARMEGRIETTPGDSINWLHFGALPPVHPKDTQQSANEFIRGRNEMEKDGLWWNSYRGLAHSSGVTGAQEGFGASKLIEVTTWNDPRHLPHLRSVLESALRPSHFREADGSRVRKANHPDWWTWSDVTHFHPGQSKDRLGKADWKARYETHGWGGMDDQHDDDNLLNGLASVFESPTLMSLVEDAIEVELANVRSRGNAGAGASRAMGRRSGANAGRWMLTGSELLWDVMQEMWGIGWAGAKGRNDPLGSVRPYTTFKDPRKLLDPATGQPWDTWTIWEHGLQLTGMAAHQAIIDVRRDHNLEVTQADEVEFQSFYAMIADTLVLHAFWRDASGKWVFCQDLHYIGSDPVPQSVYQQGTNGWIMGKSDVRWGGWGDWTIPGLLYLDQMDAPGINGRLAPGTREKLSSIVDQLLRSGTPESFSTRQWYTVADWSLPT